MTDWFIFMLMLFLVLRSMYHRLLRLSWRRRKAIGDRYREELADLPLLLPPEAPEGDRHAHHIFPILVDTERLTVDRDRVLAALQTENIGVGVHYTAVHLHPFYRERYGYARGDFPNAEFISDRTVSIPFSTKLTDRDVDDVIRAIRKVLRAYTR